MKNSGLRHNRNERAPSGWPAVLASFILAILSLGLILASCRDPDERIDTLALGEYEGAIAYAAVTVPDYYGNITGTVTITRELRVEGDDVPVMFYVDRFSVSFPVSGTDSIGPALELWCCWPIGHGRYDEWAAGRLDIESIYSMTMPVSFYSNLSTKAITDARGFALLRHIGSFDYFFPLVMVGK